MTPATKTTREAVRNFCQTVQQTSSNSNSNTNATAVSRRKEYPHLYFRSILPKDRQQIQALHEVWFPVQYHDDFYDTLVQGRLVSPPPASPEADQSFESEAVEETTHSRSLYTYLALQDREHSTAAATEEDYIVVLSNKSTKQNQSDKHDNSHLVSMEEARVPPSLQQQQYNNNNDRIVACIVGAVVEASMLSLEMQNLLIPDPQRHPRLFYIMTLGTADDCRQHGLASYLVQHCIAHQVLNDPTIGTLYLHVLDTNLPAIRFYEKLGFYRVKLIPNYYTIEGRTRHCYLYAKYFHGNRGHVTVFMLLKQRLKTLWRTLRAPLSLLSSSADSSSTASSSSSSSCSTSLH